jgi:ribosomal subunit interface protein
MNYNIKGTDVTVTDELHDYVAKKLNAFDKMFGSNTAARVDIVVAYLASEERQYKAEMTLHDAKAPLHAECRGSTLHEAIDEVTGELLSELTNAKKKKRSVFRHSAVKVKEYLRGWRNKI